MALHLFYFTLPLSHRFVSICQKESNTHKDHSKMCGLHALKWAAEARNLCRKAQKQNKSYNLCPSPAHVGKSWPLAWLRVLQNSGSQMLMLDLKLHQNKISTGAVWGVRLRPSVSTWQWAIVFKYFLQFMEKQWPSTFVTFTLRLYNSYNHAHAKGPHMWPSLSPWPYSKSLKQWKSDVHVKGQNPVSKVLRSPLKKSNLKK